MAGFEHSNWPDRLWIVRHGQSAGNVARDAAELANAHLIDVAHVPCLAMSHQPCT